MKSHKARTPLKSLMQRKGLAVRIPGQLHQGQRGLQIQRANNIKASKYNTAATAGATTTTATTSKSTSNFGTNNNADSNANNNITTRMYGGIRKKSYDNNLNSTNTTKSKSNRFYKHNSNNIDNGDSNDTNTNRLKMTTRHIDQGIYVYCNIKCVCVYMQKLQEYKH